MSIIGVHTEDGNVDVIRGMIVSQGLKRGTAMLVSDFYLNSIKSFMSESFIHRSFNQNAIDRIVLFQRSLVKTTTKEEKSVPMFFILESQGKENEFEMLEDIVKDTQITVFLLNRIRVKKACPPLLTIPHGPNHPIIPCEPVGDDQYKMVGEWYSRQSCPPQKKSCCSFFKFF